MNVKRFVVMAPLTIGLCGCVAPSASATPVVSSPAVSARPAARASSLAGMQAEADMVCVPFELVDGHLVVKVQVNGQGPFNFLLDTGASDMGRADVRLASALQLPKVSQTANSDSINSATVDVVLARTVALGGLERATVELLARDYNTVPRPNGLRMGIIGRGFYADRLLTVDYPARQLRFSRGPSLGPDDLGAIRYARPFRIPIMVGDHPATGAIDTGSNLTVHMPRSLLSRIDAAEPVAAGVARRANTTFDMLRAQVRDPIRIGLVTADNVEARFSDLATEVNIGNGVLANYVLQIDQRSQYLALKQPDDPAIVAERRRQPGCAS